MVALLFFHRRLMFLRPSDLESTTFQNTYAPIFPIAIKVKTIVKIATVSIIPSAAR